MKMKKGVIYLSVSLVAMLFLAAAMFPQGVNEEKEAVLMHTILRGLDYMHYQPREIDDDFSEMVYNEYIDQLYGNGRFVTQEDVDKLKVYEKYLDDEAKQGSYEFFNLSLEIFDANLTKTQGFYREILAQPFDFSKNEKVQMDGEKRDIPKNDVELKDFWRKYLKYETLSRYSDSLEEQEEVGEEGEQKSAEVLETEAREEVLEMFDKWYERMRKLKRADRLGYFLNAVTSVFDPHTNYFKPIDKENFNIRFSGRLEGIGARLMEEEDYTKVTSIVVGGPAWKGKDLEENDIIMKVAQEGEEPVDIKGMVINDVVQLIRGDKDTKVILTVKKGDGTIKDVTIVRDIVVIDEKFAKSLILDGEKEGEKIGYLYLPSFYADFENEDGRFCAPDVAKELEKLNAANVDGIILDLRNNGGGSLRDVVKMSGFFIERGPIVQVKSKGKKPEVLKDYNQNVNYDGPLIVMVNSGSASASEILAGALQDYNRAVIVGSSSTFGKGTVQRFVNLDRTVNGYEEYKPLGDIKLTMQKFYRIDGSSTQKKGVSSDIVLPDSYHFIKTGEREQKYPLNWDEIDPVEYDQNVMQVNNMDDLRKRSNQRVKESEAFNKILENARRFHKQREETAYSLSLDEYNAEKEKQDAESALYKDMFKTEVVSGIKNLEVDLPTIHGDESKEARNGDWIKSVAKDVYIDETLKIMHDLIKSKG
jgi:carboxyl-terminal processing protease